LKRVGSREGLIPEGVRSSLLRPCLTSLRMLDFAVRAVGGLFCSVCSLKAGRGAGETGSPR
jgi:hypothetical protein